MKSWILGGMLSLSCVTLYAGEQSPEGVWTALDDQTFEKRADVRFVLKEDQLYGTIVRRYLKPGDPERCIGCPGHFKNQPIQGLQFIWGLKNQGEGQWDHGKLIDPTTGKIYHLKIRVKADQLEVRGYIGVPWLGRTQVWARVK